MGGVPKILVPDNLKAAIVKTDRYEPTINKMLEDMANHYGCFIQPARPLHPKDKSLVEDHVKLVYQRVYAELRNLVFYSIEELNRAAAEKMKAHNQKRMQQHPYTREERFLAVDRPNLLPLPAEDFEIRCYTDMKVAPNLLIIDDFGIKVLDGQQLLDFMEIIEDRHGQKSTIIVSQLPVSNWYDVLKKNTTAADAILDRIVHTAVRFDLKGESMRKNKSTKKSDITEK